MIRCRRLGQEAIYVSAHERQVTANESGTHPVGVARGAAVSAARGLRGAGADQRRRRVRAAVPPIDRRSGGLLGGDGARRADLEQAVSRRCSTGSCRMRSGSWAASSTCRRTASTATWRTRGDKAAIVWEGEPGDSRTLTYRELHARCASSRTSLKGAGIVAGDRVAIYMPMIPEAAIAMLACARIGATHTVVFGGFSAEALRDRINDCRRQAVHHRRRRLAARQGRAAEGERRRGAGRDADGRDVHRRASARGDAVDDAGRPRRLVARRDGQARPPTARRPSLLDASTRCSSSTRPAPPASRRAILHTTGGYLLGAHLTHEVRLRPARRRHLLVHRRHRLGDRAQLRRLRPAVERRDHA